MIKVISTKFALAMILLAFGLNGYAETVYVGKVIKVSDGDTFTMLLDDNTQERVRLHGIDAPEMSSRKGHRGEGGQPYCRASKEHLAQLIAGKIVKVTSQKRDRYGRILGIVSTDAVADVNLEMIRSGMAWHYSYYDNTPSYAEAEKNARAQRLGLWRDNHPTNPYEWRKKK